MGGQQVERDALGLEQGRVEPARLEQDGPADGQNAASDRVGVVGHLRRAVARLAVTWSQERAVVAQHQTGMMHGAVGVEDAGADGADLLLVETLHERRDRGA